MAPRTTAEACRKSGKEGTATAAWGHVHVTSPRRGNTLPKKYPMTCLRTMARPFTRYDDAWRLPENHLPGQADTTGFAAPQHAREPVEELRCSTDERFYLGRFVELHFIGEPLSPLDPVWPRLPRLQTSPSPDTKELPPRVCTAGSAGGAIEPIREKSCGVSSTTGDRQ